MFSSVEVRDHVAAHAKNLANVRSNGNDPVPSVRMEVPQHLRGIKRELDEYGFLLKQETTGISGISELRRSIKFNDAERTLYMDVLYPGETKWARITYAQAREGNRISQTKFETKARTRLHSSEGSFQSAMDTDPAPASQRLPAGPNRNQ